MMFLLFVAGLALELLVVLVPSAWQQRKWLMFPVASLIGLWSGILLAAEWQLLTWILALISIYRLFNVVRLISGRISEKYLRTSIRRSVIVLGVLQAIVYCIMLLEIELRRDETFLLLAVLQLMASIGIFGITGRNIFKTKHHTTKHFYSDSELPTVTVAIPARNETAELSSCIRSVIANDYPKLEVLVLDDCSQDRTPEIIKDFAQDGVRFLQGTQPTDRWLAKNHAYEQLAQSSSGEYILFCGVDVRLGPTAIRALVTTLLNKNRTMISVLPLRIGGGVHTALIQPMRYWWELALPRRLFNRPPVLSSLWVVRRRTLEKLGGFRAVSRSIIPETFFARELVKSDNYAFIRADEELDVRTVKSANAQLSTAVRMRYPQLRRRPENVLLLGMLEFVVLVVPFATAFSGVIGTFTVLHWLSVLTCFLLVVSHYQIMAVSNPANSVIALLNFPFVVLTEIVLLHVSMYRYEFSTVGWKGRNICIPVMRVVPKLPRLAGGSSRNIKQDAHEAGITN